MTTVQAHEQDVREMKAKRDDLANRLIALTFTDSDGRKQLKKELRQAEADLTAAEKSLNNHIAYLEAFDSTAEKATQNLKESLFHDLKKAQENKAKVLANLSQQYVDSLGYYLEGFTESAAELENTYKYLVWPLAKRLQPHWETQAQSWDDRYQEAMTIIENNSVTLTDLVAVCEWATADLTKAVFMEAQRGGSVSTREFSNAVTRTDMGIKAKMLDSWTGWIAQVKEWDKQAKEAAAWKARKNQ